jgi:tRNA-splicing ligase RtcB
MNVISTEKKPIKMWLSDLEETALSQAKNLANLPFVFKHIAIMPDSHAGYGMPIGAVLATNGVIVPNAVGVDIGCGMCAVKTSLKDIDKLNLQKVVDKIMSLVPVGFNWHSESQDYTGFMPKKPTKDLPVAYANYDKATLQIGTLGGGNHFIEIQKGSDGYIWIMIHSGSRNLGHKTATHYNKLAIEINERYYSEVGSDLELAFLPSRSEEAKMYLKEMNYCVEFAKQNRFLMLNRVLYAFRQFVDIGACGDIINESHNFAAWENHFGKNVIVHRKGATKANKGELGIIPGSQGTKSYIVRGLGDEMSFKSCSHGAGRVMGRKQAIRELDLKKEQSIMKDVIHNINTEEQLDEAPSAYKDIDVVMENQKDLAEIVVELKPLAVIKG